MKPAPLPATPDLMTLLCIIGGAMRGEGTVFLGMQLLLIGTMVPRFGWLIRAWIRLQEREAAGHVWVGEPCDEPDDDAPDELRSGWVRQEGSVWLWRHVSRVGVVFVPIRFVGGCRIVMMVRRVRLPAVLQTVLAPFQNLFFALDLADGKNCVLFVPVS